MSEIFAFASPPNGDGNVIVEVIPPVGPSSVSSTPFEVPWSFACIKSLSWSPQRVALSFFFPWVGHSCSIPVCFTHTGTDYLVSFELDVFLSNILDICCLTSVLYCALYVYSSSDHWPWDIFSSPTARLLQGSQTLHWQLI